MSVVIANIVDTWKTRTLHSADIPLEPACSSIGTDGQMFEAKKVNAVEWVVRAHSASVVATRDVLMPLDSAVVSQGREHPSHLQLRRCFRKL